MIEQTDFYYDKAIDDEIATVETITPEIAKNLLSESISQQRNEVVSHTKRLAGYISNGKWVSNGNSIKITKSGKLIDGQHRLKAVILADIPIKTWVIRNMSEEAYFHMDDVQFQRIRKLPDFLTIKGYNDTILLSSVVNTFVAICREEFKSAYGNFHTGSVSNEEALQVLINHPAIVNSLSMARKDIPKTIIGKSMAGALYYCFCVVDKTKAYEFFDMLISKNDNEPVRALKEKLRILQEKEIDEKVKVLAVVKFNLLVETFNNYLLGRKVRNLEIDGINVIKINGFNLYCKSNEIPNPIKIH